MSENNANIREEWIDPDDAPELTDEMMEMGEIRIGGRIVQHATGVLTKDGMKRVENMRPIPFPVLGRPPVGEEAKEQVSLRLDRDVINWFRAGGKGWQTRMNAALRKAAGV
jgi:uncharacterized protein (DUF4415 family)